MNLVFLCGSLEKGKNGVGDYTRIMGKLVHEMGHAVSLIALNDNYLDQDYQEEKISSSLYIYRIADHLKDKDRYSKVKEIIITKKPDWVSLQYVPFSFHKKGIPLNLGANLKSLENNFKWHIMFHELWIGMEKGANTKNSIIGNIQKTLIKKLIIKLNPKIINTQLPLYKEHLKKIGCTADILPLYSNIERVENKRDPITKKDRHIQIALFGGMQFGAKFKEFIIWLTQFTTYSIEFQFIGKTTQEKESWYKLLKAQHIKYTDHGFSQDEKVSNILNQCDWGLTGTPFILLAKSGSVAAMIDHDLKVICIARDWIPKNLMEVQTNDSFIDWNKQICIDDILRHKNPSKTTPKIIADQFLKSLSKNL